MKDFTTMEKIAMRINPCYGAMLQWNEQVFVTDLNQNGRYFAKIYEMIDLEDAPSRIEARLSLIEEADESFVDSGHAIQWCLENA